jgi:hypothetical protein
MAQVVEILESTFKTSSNTNIVIELNDQEFGKILKNLNYDNDTKSIISIGSVNFTFLKK